MQHNKYHMSYMEKPIERRERIIVLKSEQKESLEVIKSKKEAEKILFEAQKEAERLIYEAKTSNDINYTNGYKQGEKAGLNKYNTKMNEAVAIAEDMLKEKYKMIQNHEKDIVSLALKISNKVIGKEIDRDHINLKNIFETAIGKIIEEGYEIIKVRMNKRNVERFYPSNEIEEFMLDIKSDKKLKDKQCTLETENGEFDINYNTQLNEIEEKLNNVAG